ncbi:MAG: type I-D CRISPR-associated helicase Cas3' [Candidatus Cloacimonetes bacterium]|nr:type I-D CRISPR-associated helicase Cas3' [Candidatus Cloacimonadota bacterium]MBL7086988.1 type I-D CRISPR-associated helicase Cas3' [Candidatus Cloacimonadota bacterium]
MKIDQLKLETYPVKNAPNPLYKHQKQIHENWFQKNTFILISGTGSGKTIAASFPIIENNENAVFVYPTNALIEDQKRSIENILKQMGKKYFVYDENSFKIKPSNNVDFTLLKIDGDFLKKVKEFNNFKTKGDALYFLLSHNKGKTIVLTNPDILFLILTLKYRGSANIIALFDNFNTIVFDEFHVYWGIELTNLISSLFFLSKLDIFPKKVFLTATPSSNVLKILNNIFQPMVIEIESNKNIGRTVVHKVDLYGIQVEKDNKIKKVIEKLFSIKDTLIKNRVANSQSDYIPLVVILNSVVEVIVLEKELLKAGFTGEEITPIRGLMLKSERKTTSKTLIVIGTSAIEIGIDFSCDYLIFEANDSSSFLQRFGRIGRHNNGIAYLLGNRYETESMNEKKRSSRYEFQSFINAVYDAKKSFSWFIKTRLGLFVSYVQFQQFIEKIQKDRNLVNKEKNELKETFENWFYEYVSVILDDSTDNSKRLAKDALNLLKKSGYFKWTKVYKNYYSLRSSFNSELVFVKSEEKLGRYPLIKADVISILRYGKNLKWNNIKKRLEVDSFTERNKIRFSKQNILPEDYGEIQIFDESNPHKLLINDHKLPLSEIRENHIMAYFPKIIVEGINYDWRLQSIFCNDNQSVVAFGKNVLLMVEMYKSINWFNNDVNNIL